MAAGQIEHKFRARISVPAVAGLRRSSAKFVRNSHCRTPVGPALTACGGWLTVRTRLSGEGGLQTGQRPWAKGRNAVTKRLLDTFVVGSLRFVRGALALALCLGTFGVALTVVGASPAAAAGVPTIASVTPATGLPAGGTKVTIVGTNLTAATAVDFGTAAGTITKNTAGQVVVTSPASPLPGTGLGTVDITVTTASGTSAIVPADQFQYVNAPTVTALYGGNGPQAGGTTIIIAGTNFIGVTAVEFRHHPRHVVHRAVEHPDLGRRAADQHRDAANHLQRDGDHRLGGVGQGDGQPVVLVRRGHVHFQRDRCGEQRGAAGCERLHPRRRGGYESEQPLGRHVHPIGVHGSRGLGHDRAHDRVPGGAHGGHRHRDRAGRQRRERGVARLVGQEQLFRHQRIDLQRPQPGLQPARVGTVDERWMPDYDRLVQRGRAAGVLRHRPQRDLPTIAGPDRRRAGRLQRWALDGGDDQLEPEHLHRGHLADLLRQRPDAGPGHSHVLARDGGARTDRHAQHLWQL